MKPLRSTHKAILGLAVLAAVLPQVAHAQVAIANPSFETDPQGNYMPITGWDAAKSGDSGGFGTDAAGGSLANSSGVFANNGTIPDGSSVAFLQATGDDVTMSQSLTGFKSGDRYVVTFYDNERAYSGPATLIVTLGGTTIVPATSVSPVGDSNPYNFVTAVPYTANGSTATLTFTNHETNGDDTSILIDNVAIRDISAAPEPSQTAALGLGVLGLSALALKKRACRTA